MGISGLLPLLKKASKNSHVRKFSGCTVAIDAYCWLHKGKQILKVGNFSKTYLININILKLSMICRSVWMRGKVG